jgi:eukaryotic-like serine/threonine-protein kinase
MGQGGMGTVYEALHVIVKRRFAVKFLRADLAQRRDALARFQREAAAAGALESENIAQAVDFGIADDGAPYIVMEYLLGRDLARLLKCAGPLAVERATDIVIQACNGIQAAHAAGVIHRDLKPANLYICRRSDESDLVKIVDFGIAKLQAADPGNTITSTGGILGTPAYMSPEQARGSSLLDERADVYALGVILYELLSGHTPHPGDSHNAVIYHISTQAALPLEAFDRELPSELIVAVMRALATNSEERQASAAEFARQLAPFARREVWPIPEESASAVSNSRQSISTLLSVYPPHREASAVVDSRESISTLLSAHPQHYKRISSSPLVVAHPTSNARGLKRKVTVAGAAVALALLVAFGIAARHKLRVNATDELGGLTEAKSKVTSAGVDIATPITTPTPGRDNTPTTADFAPAINTHPAPEPQVSPAANTKAPLVTTSRVQRPRDTGGRPSGHPPPLNSSSVASSNPAGLNGVRVTFDSKNPYE